MKTCAKCSLLMAKVWATKVVAKSKPNRMLWLQQMPKCTNIWNSFGRLSHRLSFNFTVDFRAPAELNLWCHYDKCIQDPLDAYTFWIFMSVGIVFIDDKTMHLALNWFIAHRLLSILAQNSAVKYDCTIQLKSFYTKKKRTHAHIHRQNVRFTKTCRAHIDNANWDDFELQSKRT